MKHRTYVQNIGCCGGYFASCMTCGCDPFPTRDTREAAEADARDHGDFVTDFVVVPLATAIAGGPPPLAVRPSTATYIASPIVPRSPAYGPLGYYK